MAKAKSTAPRLTKAMLAPLLGAELRLIALKARLGATVTQVYSAKPDEWASLLVKDKEAKDKFLSLDLHDTNITGEVFTPNPMMRRAAWKYLCNLQAFLRGESGDQPIWSDTVVENEDDDQQEEEDMAAPLRGRAAIQPNKGKKAAEAEPEEEDEIEEEEEEEEEPEDEDEDDEEEEEAPPPPKKKAAAVPAPAPKTTPKAAPAAAPAKPAQKAPVAPAQKAAPAAQPAKPAQKAAPAPAPAAPAQKAAPAAAPAKASNGYARLTALLCWGIAGLDLTEFPATEADIDFDAVGERLAELQGADEE